MSDLLEQVYKRRQKSSEIARDLIRVVLFKMKKKFCNMIDSYLSRFINTGIFFSQS